MTHLLTYQAPIDGGCSTNCSLSIGGTPVQLPDQINVVANLSGIYGVHIVQLAIDVMLFVAAFLAFAYIFYGGWKWLTSEGDKKKIEEARNTIVFSLIGLIVMALAYLIISVVGAFFGVKILGAN